ncbi:MAG: hypothetical protein JNL28_08635 [Planctomycetes bacterium]|nr:hypothetical protein [Planctomycetota bacterium]
MGAASPSAEEAARDLTRDDRIAVWMGGCARDEAFLQDTSDVIPVLVSKLSTGQVDPLRAAREELARYGERAIPELRRAFDAALNTQFMDQRVQNVVEVLGLMRTDAGREMILRALEHPQQTVRKAAARALQNHARPEDYERVLAGLATSGGDAQGDFALALVACDRKRVERQLVEWIREGHERSLVDLLVVHLCTTRDRETTALWRSVVDQTEGKLLVFLKAAIANEPDESTLAELRGWLMDTTRPPRRQVVAQALAKVGLARELGPLVVRTDQDESLRKLAIESVAAAPFTNEMRAVLQAGLADPSPEVRDIALIALCVQGDSGGLDTAFEFLKGSRVEMDSALKALRGPMAADEKVARRVFELLTQVQAGDVGRGLVDDRTLIRSIGQVPLADAAAFIMRAGEIAEGTIQGWPAHRWYAQAAGNTGSAGLAYLRSRWLAEGDPSRRMDLVMAGSFEKSDAVRQFLMDVLECERCEPSEVLYAADRLARFGPMEEVASVLKRAALGMGDRRVRPGFNCLLWTWYGTAD